MANLVAALRACEAEVVTLTLTLTLALLLTKDYWLLATGCLVLAGCSVLTTHRVFLTTHC